MRLLKLLIVFILSVVLLMGYVAFQGSKTKPPSVIEDVPASITNAKSHTNPAINTPAPIGASGEIKDADVTSLLGDVSKKPKSLLPVASPIKASMLIGDQLAISSTDNSNSLGVIFAVQGDLHPAQAIVSIVGKKKTKINIQSKKWIILLFSNPPAAVDAKAALVSTGMLDKNIAIADNAILMTSDNYHQQTPAELAIFNEQLSMLDLLA